jgi:Importin repeat 6
VYTLSKLGDLLHALFSTYKEAFLPVFDQLLPFVVKLLVRKEKIARSYLNEEEMIEN